MRQTIRRYRHLPLMLAAALLALACQADPSAWYPEGTATLATWYERSDGSDKACVLEFQIENTGSSRISRSTISVEVKTAARSYHASLVSELAILPGGKVYAKGSVTYADAAEVTSLEGISVVSAFFE